MSYSELGPPLEPPALSREKAIEIELHGIPKQIPMGSTGLSGDGREVLILQ